MWADRAPAAGRGVRSPRSRRINRLHSGGARHWIRHAAAGVFVTLEGPDGSGKSSLLRGLARPAARRPAATSWRRASRARRRSASWSAASSSTPSRRSTGPAARTRSCSPPRARSTCDEVIRPALERGALVVCDRYADSSMAYQGVGLGRADGRAARPSSGSRPAAWRPTSRSSSTCRSRPGSRASRRRSRGSRRTRTSRTTSASATAFLAFAAAEPGPLRDRRRDRVDEAAVLDAAMAALERGWRRWPRAVADGRGRACRRGEPRLAMNRRPPGAHDTMSDARLDPGGRARRSRRPRPTRAPGRAGRRTARGAGHPVRPVPHRWPSESPDASPRDDALAEDVVQEAFLGAWRERGPIRGRAAAACRRGCSSIVHHRAIDAVRRRRPASELPAEQEGARTPDALIVPDVWGEVAGRLDARRGARRPWRRSPTHQRQAWSSPTSAA